MSSAPRTRTSRRRVALLTLTVAVVGGALVAPATAAQAAHLKTWTGKVKKKADGDTTVIDVAGDHKGRVLVRNAGIQAMEIAHGRSKAECHAAAAAKRMTGMVVGKKVRLTATKAGNKSEGRLLRYVDVKTKKGYVDTQLKMLNEGHALWLDLSNETAHSKAYHVAMEQAATRGKNLWDDNYCGNGPSQSAKLKIWVNYDADGDDAKNLNGEYIRVKNVGTVAAGLGKWRLRDASHAKAFTFPSGTILNPGVTFTVHTGKGTRHGNEFYRGLSSMQYGNPGHSGTKGDGAYLFDAQGDIRSHMTYPCVYRCTDPLKGKVTISRINYDADGDDAKNPRGEYTQIAGVSRTARVDISNTVVELGGRIWEIPSGTVLSPGQKLTIRSGKGTNTRYVHYWQTSTPMLSNSGGVVSLRNTQGTRLACRDYGNKHC